MEARRIIDARAGALAALAEAASAVGSPETAVQLRYEADATRSRALHPSPFSTARSLERRWTR